MDLAKAKRSEIINHIRVKKKELEYASKKLKEHFVGLDEIIDKIISNLTTWYIFPQLLSRPVIICLFGMTGTGKTDMVRRLTRLLNFQDRFCEIELMNKGGSNSYSWHSSVGGILGSNLNIQSGKPSIILFDEIQNFRTLDEHGHELSEYKFRDLWTLLSDGRLPFKPDLESLLQLLWEYKEKKRNAEGGKDVRSPSHLRGLFEDDSDLEPDEVDGEADETPNDDQHPDISADEDSVIKPTDVNKVLKRFKQNGIFPPEINEDDEDDLNDYYSLKHFKNILRLKESLEEIAQWSIEKRKALITKKLNDPNLYNEEDYVQSLIFISGNIDEAYEFSKNTSEVDIDADIFHELSLKINILDIKEALTQRFKPEQIARFGNNQIIYPSLSKKSYQTIIKRKIREIKQNVKKKFKVTLKIDKTVEKVIYQNGVFPTQGTRPVFSTISEFLESRLPVFLLNLFIKGEREATLFYKDQALCASIKNKIIKQPYNGSLDILKNERDSNFDAKILSSVHEAGHAVVYALLFKLAPPQLTSSPLSKDVGGFVYVHGNCESKRFLEDKMSVLMSGVEAEKMVFGEDNKTSGGKMDIYVASKCAGKMIQHYGMSKFEAYIAYPEKTDIVNNDLDCKNDRIESLVSQSSNKAKQLLEKNKELFIATVDALFNEKKVTPKDFQSICKKHGLKIDIKNSKVKIYSDYKNQYDEFKKL